MALLFRAARTPTYGTPLPHRFRGGAQDILHNATPPLVRHLAGGRLSTGLVFRRPGGKRCGHGQIDWMVMVARERAGLAGITSHSLRHTHASRLIAAGWDVAEIAA